MAKFPFIFHNFCFATNNAAPSGGKRLFNIICVVTIPPVGKSGPFTISQRSSMSFFILNQKQNSITYLLKLCGGIFEAIPTAIPTVPFMSKFGNFAGSTLVLCVFHQNLEQNLRCLFPNPQAIPRDGLKFCFGISIGSRRITIKRSKVSLDANERITHGKILRHAHERFTPRNHHAGDIYQEHLQPRMHTFKFGV